MPNLDLVNVLKQSTRYSGSSCTLSRYYDTSQIHDYWMGWKAVTEMMLQMALDAAPGVHGPLLKQVM